MFGNPKSVLAASVGCSEESRVSVRSNNTLLINEIHALRTTASKHGIATEGWRSAGAACSLGMQRSVSGICGPAHFMGISDASEPDLSTFSLSQPKHERMPHHEYRNPTESPGRCQNRHSRRRQKKKRPPSQAATEGTSPFQARQAPSERHVPAGAGEIETGGPSQSQEGKATSAGKGIYLFHHDAEGLPASGLLLFSLAG